MMKKFPVTLTAALLGLALVLRASADPAAQPTAPSISSVRVQTLKSYTYAYVSTQTTLSKIQDAISTLMPKIDAAVDAGQLRPLGPYVFTYHGATGQQDKPFTLDIGVIVKDNGKRPDGIQFTTVGAEECATVVFTGPVAKIGDAYGKLFGEIGRRGLQPSDVSREFYLYWEGADSENNIVQVQAVLQQSAPGN
jgi:DNA gyrase inhibitor GyrI